MYSIDLITVLSREPDVLRSFGQSFLVQKVWYGAEQGILIPEKLMPIYHRLY